jgi:hypothetical protein
MKSHQFEPAVTWGFVLRVIAKAAALFVLLNIIFAALNPLEPLGRLTLYSTILPGRARLPYGEDSAQSYNLSLNNIPAMLASHVIARQKAPDEFRVILIGDSSTWGWFLENRDTLAARLNQKRLVTVDGRRIVAYNLGYPIMSLSKDLLLLDAAMSHQPDMLVWLVTLESFARDKQLVHPLLQNNPARMRRLIADYQLQLDPRDARFVDPDFARRTIVGQRRALADLVRLQLYGVAWAATGIDQSIPREMPLRQSDFDADIRWQSFDPPLHGAPTPLAGDELAFDVLAAGLQRAGAVPLLIVNEPMYISRGKNSQVRYNSFYPRWAYDAYRARLTATAQANGWRVLDVWDSIAPDEFTNTPVHLTPQGSAQLAESVSANLR